MEPKKLIVAPNIPASEIIHLRAHVDEAGPCGPDYSVVTNYVCNWEDEGGKVLEDLPDSHVNACGPYFTVDGEVVPEDPKE
jgi:hypothetical protein